MKFDRPNPFGANFSNCFTAIHCGFYFLHRVKTYICNNALVKEDDLVVGVPTETALMKLGKMVNFLNDGRHMD